MKKIITGLSLVLSLSAMAKPVFIFPSCYANPFMGECTLYNSSDEVVTCNVQVQGFTQQGFMVTNFQYVTLYQRQMSWIRVYANNPSQDPLVRVNGNAFCNTNN